MKLQVIAVKGNNSESQMILLYKYCTGGMGNNECLVKCVLLFVGTVGENVISSSNGKY